MVLERNEEMNAAAQQIGLKTGFTVQRNEAFLQRFGAETFFHNTDAVIGNEFNGGEEQPDRDNDPNVPE
jgi:hypothetical protein